MVADWGQQSVAKNEWPGTASSSTIAEAEGPTALEPLAWIAWVTSIIAIRTSFPDLKSWGRCRKLPIILELFPVPVATYYSQHILLMAADEELICRDSRMMKESSVTNLKSKNVCQWIDSCHHFCPDDDWSIQSKTANVFWFKLLTESLLSFMQEPTERLLNDIGIEHDVESCQHPPLLCVYFLYVVSAVSIHSYIKAVCLPSQSQCALHNWVYLCSQWFQ